MNKENDKANPFEEVTKEFKKLLDNAGERITNNPAYIKKPTNYESLCVEWTKRDVWTLKETANLLCSASPVRPSIVNGDQHSLLNTEVRQLSELLKRSDMPFEGKPNNKSFLSKDVIKWAENKKIRVPDELLRALGISTNNKLSTASHGNTTINAEKREQILGAALAVINKWPDECKHGSKFSAPKIAQLINDHASKWWKSGNAPYAVDTMERHIGKYLNFIK